MKKIIPIVLLAALLFSCGSKTGNRQAESITDSSIVNVYYFHGNQRCKTCLAIEDVAKSTIADTYKDNANVKFIEINIDKDENKDIVEKYEIAFSSLLIAKGEDYIDITEQAFANAINTPDVLTNLIIDEVSKHIN